jgi:DNA-binding NarL/FixJ family response regulator
MATVSLRVVIADDSLLLREGVARVLEAAGFEVVAEAGDGEELMRRPRAPARRGRDQHPDAANA